MPFYANIDNSTEEGRRTARRLLTLRRQLDAEIPPRGISGNLIIATWNLREFESPAYGKRRDEPLYYIAEVISRFDLVAIQEVREDLSSLEKVRGILGAWWKILLTDVTEGTAGNDERMAFLYDSRKVTFGGLASDLVLPPVKLKNRKTRAVRQPARSPFICGFQAGWFRFSVCTAHAIYGKGGANSKEREQEIRAVATFLASRAERRSADRWSRNVVLLGDFNIFTTKSAALKALQGQGFEVPAPIFGEKTNATRTRTFDQIAFKTGKGGFELTGRAGVFDFYKSVYTEADAPLYADQMGKKYSAADSADNAQKYYRTYWRTYQMSDHLPLWTELNTDFSDHYLKQKTKQPVLTTERVPAHA